jgi:hypothetical protein
MNKVKMIALILACGNTPEFFDPNDVNMDSTSVDIIAADGVVYFYPLHQVNRVKVIHYTDEELLQIEQDQQVENMLKEEREQDEETREFLEE